MPHEEDRRQLNLDTDFIDEAVLKVRSGRGGCGSVHFRREKFIPKGGPDGGNGGAGGDIRFRALANLSTLATYRYRRHFAAEDGHPGQGSHMEGRGGGDLLLEVPLGTMIFDHESDELLADLSADGQEVVLLAGGRGGKGNAHFKSAVRQSPRYAQPGEEGTSRVLRLELKLLSDVGLVGLPNAGKSSLISVISNARPKIAAYPFTTLTPHLGVVRFRDGDEFVVSDIPGLIAGAHEGIGLGIRFLRHIERARLLCLLVDLAVLDDEHPFDQTEVLLGELEAFLPGLAARVGMVVLAKADLVPEERGQHLLAVFGERFPQVQLVSSATRRGVDELLRDLQNLLLPRAET